MLRVGRRFVNGTQFVSYIWRYTVTHFLWQGAFRVLNQNN